jgi:photosystem II stability/assembly factor-like uncharacterized protein
MAAELFRSQDAGESWTQVLFAPADQGWSAWGILVEATSPTRIYVAATTSDRYAIFMSPDHGATWSSTLTAPPIQTSSLTADPSDAKVLFAGTTEGIYKSSDAGDHWSLTKSDVPYGLLRLFDVRQIVTDPQNLGTLYAAATYLGILKSTDRGETWSSIRTGLGYEVVSSIAIDPLDSQLIYAGTESGVYRSANGGATWQRSFDLGTTPIILGTEPAGGYALADGGTGSFFTIIGKGFDAQSVVSWNGAPLGTSRFACTRLFIQVPSEDLATPGTASLTVINPDGSRSDPFSFVIEPILPYRFPVLTYAPARPRRGPLVLPPRP